MRAPIWLLYLVLGSACAGEYQPLDDDEVAYLQFVARFADRVCAEAAVCDPENEEYYCELGYDGVEPECAGFDVGAAQECLEGRWYCDPHIAWPISCIDVCAGNDLGFGG